MHSVSQELLALYLIVELQEQDGISILLYVGIMPHYYMLHCLVSPISLCIGYTQVPTIRIPYAILLDQILKNTEYYSETVMTLKKKLISLYANEGTTVCSQRHMYIHNYMYNASHHWLLHMHLYLSYITEKCIYVSIYIYKFITLIIYVANNLHHQLY